MLPMRVPDLPPYRPPVGLRGGHRQTVVPSVFRRVRDVTYDRERLDLPDGDFLDLDWLPATAETEGVRRVALIAHGLEGSSHRAYVKGMAKTLAASGWDVCAWNLRGCSGEPNRLLRVYHSGATEDLDAVVRHALARGYGAVALVGFSLGGNLTLRWLGEQGAGVPPEVVGAACFSVPVDLAGSAAVMERATRRPYMRRFMRALGAKATYKATQFADAPDPVPVARMRTFRAFDNHFTAPVHGFASADAYWAEASALPVLADIRVPTLLVNALDDPFLGPGCYPSAIAAASPWLTLVAPRRGGHVGFLQRGGTFWSETVADRFLRAALGG